ncbi:interferon-induced transmembrane protein 1-like isoform X1 [Kryptolebias marmoratus]|uniref:interferon-induced transmembrane protein 1-like isoform X1 n=1 Tax=Kryptolebias marmoratus TaxID=37003 RepID=UPI000D52FC42|nr:interferon-induced transmembrane protein 1-like isoform X1 [Kryptolebias marmoratus]
MSLLAGLQMFNRFLQTSLQTSSELRAMNPTYPTGAYPPEAVALQGRGPDGFSGQPGVPTGVQYTTVNIPAEPPKDYIIWSFINYFYGNICCLGLAAFIFSIKARDRKIVGDHQGAQKHGSTARCLNIWATVFNSVLILIVLIVCIVVSVKIDGAMHSMPSNSYNNRYNYGK